MTARTSGVVLVEDLLQLLVVQVLTLHHDDDPQCVEFEEAAAAEVELHEGPLVGVEDLVGQAVRALELLQPLSTQREGERAGERAGE
jgi:hypothetical protein